MYNNDPALPIFQSGKRERYTVREAARILMQNDETKKCTKTPLKVRRSMSFLIDVKSFKHWEDVKSDMNGSYSRSLRIGTWTLEIDGNRNVEVLYKKEVPLQQNSQFHIYINSKMNAAGLRRSIFFLRDKSGTILGDKCLLEYHIEENCQSVEFDVKLHGNRKNGKKPFYPMQRSTMEAMKLELSNNSPSVAFKNVASESGGVMGAQNPGQLPRSRQQLYDLKFKMNKSDQVDELLLYSKQKDETVVFIMMSQRTSGS